jgi:hypothetical protein
VFAPHVDTVLKDHKINDVTASRYISVCKRCPQKTNLNGRT